MNKNKFLNAAYSFGYSLLLTNPFIRMLAISGSVTDPQIEHPSDIDYFIISKANRVWECNLVIYLFKLIYSKLLRIRTALFCCNYIIDENHIFEELTINRIAAKELLRLKILYGGDVYRHILQKYKEEIAQYFPRMYQRNSPRTGKHLKGRISLDMSKSFTIIKDLFAVVIIFLIPLFKQVYKLFEYLRKQFLQKQEINTDKIYSNEHVIRWNIHFS